VLRERLKNYTEIAYFGTVGEGASVVNFCLSHIELLKRFTSYFKEVAAPSIKIQETNKIIPPTIYISKEKQIKTFDQTFADNPAVQQFLNSTKTKRYRISNSDQEEYLTNKEYECLNWAAMGKSAEEIGLILEISKRTVEDHLEKIKSKMQCHKLTKLIYDAMNQGLIMRSRYIA
jgi:DNA-binding CsgD family transcriptional regulator